MWEAAQDNKSEQCMTHQTHIYYTHAMQNTFTLHTHTAHIHYTYTHCMYTHMDSHLTFRMRNLVTWRILLKHL